MASVDAEITPTNGDLYFSSDEFYRLRQARLSTAFISLSFDFIAICVFIYLVLFYRSQVNRPSIRCAVFCCLANFLESLLFVVMIKVSGPSLFCFGMSLTSQYLAVLGVTLLAIIGINLVLVYVVNFRRRHVLEYYYYPISLLYSMIGITGPIVQHTINRRDHVSSYSHGTCWYIDIIKSRYNQPLNYMWFYSSIFLPTVIALLCSTIAIIKLMKDYRTLQNLFKSRRPNNNAVSKQVVPAYSQVVVRCLLYPIVPLVSNFCGFLAQCIIVTGVYPSYSLNLASNILHGLSGFFVALIFLNDPVITQILSGWYDHWFSKHVIEYVLIETNHVQYIRVFDGTNNAGDRAAVLVSFPPSKENKNLKLISRFCFFNFKCRCAILACCDDDDNRKKQRSLNRSHHGQYYDNGNRDNIILGVDCPDTIESSSIKKEIMNNSANNTNTNTRMYTIPARRLKLSSATVNQYIDKRYFTAYILLKRSFSRNITVEEAVNGYSILIGEDDDADNYLLIPYPYVHYAKFIRWLLNGSIGRAFHRPANALIDVTIAGESARHSHHLRRGSQSIASANPIEEL